MGGKKKNASVKPGKKEPKLHKKKQSELERNEERKRKENSYENNSLIIEPEYEKNKRSGKRNKRNRKIDSKLEDEDIKQLTQQQLDPIGLMVKKVTGDGNCLFRAFADQMTGNQEEHLAYRERAVEYMKITSDYFAPFCIDQTFEEYLKDMSEDGEWGDNLCVQALSMAYGVNIRIFQLGKPVFDIVNHTNSTSSNNNGAKMIQLSYHLNEHYNSVHFKSEAIKQVYENHGINVGGNVGSSSNSGSANGGNVGSSSEMSKKEMIIMETSGCKDLEMIREALEMNYQDMDATIDYLCQQKYWNKDSDKFNNNIKKNGKNNSLMTLSNNNNYDFNFDNGESALGFLSGSADKLLKQSKEENDVLLQSCMDMIFNTLGYDSGFDIELIRDLCIQHHYQADVVIDFLTGGTNNNSGTSKKSNNKNSSTTSDAKTKKLTKKEKKEAKIREKLMGAKKNSSSTSSSSNNNNNVSLDDYDIDEAILRSLSSVRI
ncbi:hypothetical protein ABK040_012059 [Willaertia magna]